MLLGLGAAAPVVAREMRGDQPGRVFFERGEANFNRGKFEEARADYQAAYDVEPLPAFLFNIGQCYRNLGDYERAQFFFQRYTMLDPHSANRPAADRLIAEMSRLAQERREAAARDARAPILASTAAVPAPAAGASASDHAAPLVGPVVQETHATSTRPIYRRTWFWVGVGGAIVAGTALAFALAQDTPRGTLPSIDAR
jgi:tetratricopeptide (TPR) repeat protein